MTSPSKTHNSPSRPPFASLNSHSLNSPSRQPPSSLRDTIHKSAHGTQRKAISSNAATLAASAAAAPTGTTKKRSTSPSKQHRRNASPSKSNRGLDETLNFSTLENLRDAGSRRGSPVKGQSGPSKSSAGLAAGGGLGRMDVVGNDLARLSLADTKKSPSKKGKHYDRYIPSRSTSTSSSGGGNDHTGPIIMPTNIPSDLTSSSLVMSSDSDPTHTSDLSASLGIDPSKRILSFFAEPPPAQGEHSSLLTTYARRPGARPGGSASGSQNAAQVASTRRRIAMSAERVLDAPGLIDDYYLNLLDWSTTNLVAIALGDSVYVWNAETGEVNMLCSLGSEDSGVEGSEEYVCSIKFAEDGTYLAVGLSNGAIQVYDVTTGTRIRTMSGHLSRVPTLSWSGAILSSGCRTGEIWNSDVRLAQHKVSEMRGHRGEVCGLAWRVEVSGGLSGGGQGLLASGGNDNVVNVWDGRMINTPKMTKTNHTAAVKALAWCPWDSKLLASGGGSSDRTIHFWNAQTSARFNSLLTPSQVTSLVFNPHSRELLSSHGIPDHQLSIWAYPSLTKITDIPQAHETRILHSCISPDGTVVATASSDENLKFWRVFEAKKNSGADLSGKLMTEREVSNASGIQRKGQTGIRVR